MKKIVILALSLFLGGNAWGQSTGELLNFSQFSNSLTTARSAAMGGAFTSLGADLSAMSINPAGLAMYGRSEIAVTPALLINNMKMTNNVGRTNNNSLTQFVVSNVAGVFSNGNFAIGLGYNRLADFNGRYTVDNGYQGQSIGNMYASMLDGVYYKDISTPIAAGHEYDPFFNFSPTMWGAIMGYQAAVVDPTGTGYKYTMEGIFSPQYGDKVAPTTSLATSGAFNEFTISGAYNVNDILYIGATLGIPHLYYSENYTYSEYADKANRGKLQSLTTGQSLNIDGSGVNFKVGVTVRPLDWLRVGVAYHSPNWLTMRERSYNDMTVYRSGLTRFATSDTPYLDQDYSTYGPSRLMAGASFTLAKIVIISADYERTWYNAMGYSSNIFFDRMRMPNQSTIYDNFPNYVNNTSERSGVVDLNSIVKKYYKATNSYRVGIEANVYKGLFLRAGYAYSESPYSTEIITEMTKTNPEILQEFDVDANSLKKYGETSRYSGGIGYRTAGGFGFDLTYVYSTTGILPTKGYYYYGATDVYQTNGVTKGIKELHQIMGTFIFKF